MNIKEHTFSLYSSDWLVDQLRMIKKKMKISIVTPYPKLISQFKKDN